MSLVFRNVSGDCNGLPLSFNNNGGLFVAFAHNLPVTVVTVSYKLILAHVNTSKSYSEILFVVKVQIFGRMAYVWLRFSVQVEPATQPKKERTAEMQSFRLYIVSFRKLPLIW